MAHANLIALFDEGGGFLGAYDFLRRVGFKIRSVTQLCEATSGLGAEMVVAIFLASREQVTYRAGFSGRRHVYL